jgi:hypothetical protein
LFPSADGRSQRSVADPDIGPSLERVQIRTLEKDYIFDEHAKRGPFYDLNQLVRTYLKNNNDGGRNKRPKEPFPTLVSVSQLNCAAGCSSCSKGKGN